jgi:hypothetical protein
LAALVLAGCNKIGLVYEFADKLVLYNVEENFDLDKEQRAALKDSVQAYFRWHRRNLLPAYADFLAYVADSARNGLRPEEVRTGMARFQELYRRTLDPVAGISAAFLESLSPAQVDAWINRQRAKNRKLRNDFSGSLEERLDIRARKIIDELEDWTGRLSKDQKARIRALNGTVPWNGSLWLDLREQVQERVADMARRKAPADSLRAYLAAYFLRDESLKTPEYRERVKESERKTAILIYQIHHLLTDGQRAHFLQQVDKLAQDLRARSRSE